MVAVLFPFPFLSLLFGRVSAVNLRRTGVYMGIALCAYGFFYLRFAWHNEVLSLNFPVESRKAFNTCSFKQCLFK
jgi:hypothetical protein